MCPSDLSKEEGTGKRWVGALTGGALARIGAPAIRAIPGVGGLLGGLSMSIASGASTWRLAKSWRSTWRPAAR